MSNNGAQQSYANDRASSTGDADVGIDPASGSFFSADYKRHEDLKTMLDSNKDGLKLEAMKRIIGMIAKGKDASDLFPAVVKNVVSKNIEVKKLVYVYLVRYAEEQQDLALLSISTFQRGLKDPNQLIRASALRVLSSIRVPVITPIMMLAIKESVTDMSPFVRKTAAHAIPKLHSLDPEQKEFCVEIIEKLLSDKTTLVIGSAVMAFEEVCPEKIDLIHKNYRKLCNLLVDVEEWGQLVIINMLTRYARTQFLNPNKYGEHMQQSEKFYDSSEDDSGGDNNSTPATTPEAPRAFTMDADHRLLLRNAKPLLQSRNAAVVMGVAQLYHHVAPKTEVGLVAKPLVRLLRSHREIQSVVLSNIATMTTTRKSMFEPYLKSFFVRPMDPTHIKLLKLEILTNLATEASIGIILREFHTYVASSDKDFVAATIQAIGRCASTISECTETCMNGLVSLMSNRDEAVVAESVVVVKKLLQMEPSKHKDIIVHMAKLVDKIAVPMARASILWLIGEYAERVPKIAPDVLRKVAKSFVNENDIVKLQTLNLATKLFLTNSKQVALLCTYVFNLAKYDQNYDIRDRARLLRQLALPSEKAGVLNKHAKKIFLSAKPAPVLESMFKERDQFQLGTLSHFNNAKASGYQELPDWPATAADPSVRNVEVPMPWSDPTVKSKKTTKKKQSFYSDSEHSSEDSSSGSDSDSDTSEESGSEEEEEEDAEAEEAGSSKSGKDGEEAEEEEEESSESDESSSEAEDSSSEEEESEEEPVVVVKPKKRPPKHSKAPKKEAVDLLLDLDDVPSVAVSPFLKPGETLTPSLLSSGSTSEKTSTMQLTVTAPAHVPTRTHELLNRMAGAGLSVSYRFTRGENIYSASMVTVELTLTNHSDNDIKKISLVQKKSSPGMELKSFPEIECLAVGESRSATIGIDYADTTQPAVLEVVVAATGSHAVSLPAPVGEQLQPIIITDNDFRLQQAKLKGMNENTGSAALPPAAAAAAAAASGREAGGGGSEAWLRQRVYDVANLAPVPAPDLSTLHFAARTRASHAFVLVSVRVADGNAAAFVVVHCEKMVVGSMLLKEITKSLCAA